MKSDDTDKQKHYQERVKAYQEKIQGLIKIEADTLEECRKNSSSSALKLFHLANEMLNMTSHYIVISGISRSVLNKRDDVALNEARKTVFKALIYLENVVTGKIDAAFSEYEENLKEIESVGIAERYGLVVKIGFTISLLKNAYGDNTKWKWSFVDIEGRYAVVVKNLFDVKTFYGNLSAASPDYNLSASYLELLEHFLHQTADRYRERFEIATQRVEDLLSAINLLRALHRIYVATNKRDEAEEIKRKHMRLEAEFELASKKEKEKSAQRDAQ
ncbi:MAG: hypothetical protein LBS82_06895 [Spirochaetaceae bacterium]|jgi:hypothetical protein|nr:hypothetical protein [Spirochaetaceae bacterium]